MAEYTWQSVAVPPTRQSGRVPLRVEPPDEVAANLRDWPVTSGVPFPKGALGSERGVQLLDSQGKTLPLQAAVTARGPTAA